MKSENWIPISRDRMLLAWALAEPNEWGKGRPAGLHRKVDAEEALTAEEEAAAVEWLLKGRRGDETAFLRGLPIEWYEADFPVADLGAVVGHKHWAGRRSWQTAPHSGQPHRTVAEFSVHRDSFETDWKPDSVQSPRPIYVATRPEGPWHVAEGSHRSVAIWRAYRRGDAEYQSSFRVILGVHPDMGGWGDFEP